MSLNDVLLGRGTGEPRAEEPYRTPAAMPPRKLPCGNCRTPSNLRQTPVGPRCATCALAYYRSVRPCDPADDEPSIAPSSSDLAIRVLVRIALVVIFGSIYAAMHMP